jgi:hypothetical protein
LNGRAFTVVVHKTRLAWPAEARHVFVADDDETATAFEVRDAQQRVVYASRRGEVPALADVRRTGTIGFSAAFAVNAIEGLGGRALWVSEGGVPSAPDACDTHVVLGLFEGKLVPFSDPFCAHIVDTGRIESQPGGSLLRLVKDAGGSGEIFEVRERQAQGNYSAIIPIRVDFVMARLRPARICRRLAVSGGVDERCEFNVDATRIAEKADTFVRLFPAPSADATPGHVVVKPASRIEFVSTLAPNVMDADGKWLGSPAEDNPAAPQSWLQVIIDGRKGWIRDQEDLIAIGLPPVG